MDTMVLRVAPIQQLVLLVLGNSQMDLLDKLVELSSKLSMGQEVVLRSMDLSHS